LVAQPDSSNEASPSKATVRSRRNGGSALVELTRRQESG
jgi:hypothetical protein